MRKRVRTSKRAQLFDKNPHCFYCGELTILLTTQAHPRLATIDHIVPKSKGGTRHNGNIVLACNSCNNRKGNKSLAEFTDKTTPISPSSTPPLGKMTIVCKYCKSRMIAIPRNHSAVSMAANGRVKLHRRVGLFSDADGWINLARTANLCIPCSVS